MTKHDIEIPMLPAGCLTEIASMMRNYASAAIKADRQRRGEPVAYFQNTNSANGKPPHYEQVCVSAKNDPDVFPLYSAPQPALDSADLAFIADELRQAGKNRAADLALTAMAHPTQPTESHVERARRIVDSWPGWKRNYKLTKHDVKPTQPAAPAQEPSDSEIMWEWANTPNTGDMRVDLSVFARALLARYGHPVEPEGWR